MAMALIWVLLTCAKHPGVGLSGDSGERLRLIDRDGAGQRPHDWVGKSVLHWLWNVRYIYTCGMGCMGTCGGRKGQPVHMHRVSSITTRIVDSVNACEQILA